MANVQKQNFALNLTTANNYFSGVWQLSRCMKKAGWTTQASSDGVTKDTSAVAANDKWGGNADPLLDVYNTTWDTALAWICMRGPSTIKLSLTAASTGTFLRGEAVTQATSGATGELVGYVFDSVGGTGWLVILPRTGTFNGTNVVTGASSAATATPTAFNEFTREVVFWKNATVTAGSHYYICADLSAESAQLFTTLAGQSDCTATVAPAAGLTGGTNNKFPALAIAVRGTAAGAGAAVHTTHINASGGTLGNCQAVAANATPSTGVSADGTFWLTYSNNGATANTNFGFGYFRLDDTESGDVDPFVWKAIGTESYSSWVRTASTILTLQYIASAALGVSPGTSFTSHAFMGYAARGTGGAKDVAAAFIASMAWGVGTASTVPALLDNAADVQRIANHPAGATAPLVQEPVRLYAPKTGIKMFKGAVRWMRFMPIGNSWDSFDTKRWMAVQSQTTTSQACLVFGPMDGSTVPTP